MRQPYGTATGATLVFYPHGSIFLATMPFEGEVKVSCSEKDYLLDEVLSKWKQEDYIPLFVGEGTSQGKLRSITRSAYLNTVYDSVLPTLEDSLVIYGWSMSEQDEHILAALERAHKLRKVAVSVNTKNSNWEARYYEMVEKLRQGMGTRRWQIAYFDAQSDGCWCH